MIPSRAPHTDNKFAGLVVAHGPMEFWH